MIIYRVYISDLKKKPTEWCQYSMNFKVYINHAIEIIVNVNYIKLIIFHDMILLLGKKKYIKLKGFNFNALFIWLSYSM